MEIVVSNRKVKLSDKEVKFARKLCNEYLSTIKKSAENNKCPTLYYTFLVVMHIITGDHLSMFDSDVLQLLLNASAIAEKRIKEKEQKTP